MAKIFRHDQVDVSGSFQLHGSGQTTATEPPSENESVPESYGSHGVQVRVIQQTPEASVLEVTCACGEVIQIRCEHEAVNP